MRTTPGRRPITDGAHLSKRNRPPERLLPESLAALAAEEDDLAERLSEARRALEPGVWSQAEAAARKADAARNAADARAGRPITNPARELEALAGRRRLAEAERDALAEALRLARNEGHAARTSELDNPVHAARLDAARARLRRAADDLEAAATDAAQALGLLEWLRGDGGFDGTARLDLRDLAPGGLLADSAPVHVRQIAAAVAALTEEMPR